MGGSRSQVNKAHKSRFASKAARNLHRTSSSFNDKGGRIAKPVNSAKGTRAARVNRKKGKALMAEFNSAVVTNDQSIIDEHSFNKVNDVYSSTVEEMNELLLNVFRELDHFHGDCTHSGEITVDITWWKDLFEKHVKKLHLNQIYDALCRVVVAAVCSQPFARLYIPYEQLYVLHYFFSHAYISKWILQIKLVNCGASRKVKVFSQVESYIKNLHVSLDLLLTFGEGIISEFSDAHKTELTCSYYSLFRIFSAVECPGLVTGCGG